MKGNRKGLFSGIKESLLLGTITSKGINLSYSGAFLGALKDFGMSFKVFEKLLDSSLSELEHIKNIDILGYSYSEDNTSIYLNCKYNGVCNDKFIQLVSEQCLVLNVDNIDVSLLRSPQWGFEYGNFGPRTEVITDLVIESIFVDGSVKKIIRRQKNICKDGMIVEYWYDVCSDFGNHNFRFENEEKEITFGFSSIDFSVESILFLHKNIGEKKFSRFFKSFEEANDIVNRDINGDWRKFKNVYFSCNDKLGNKVNKLIYDLSSASFELIDENGVSKKVNFKLYSEDEKNSRMCCEIILGNMCLVFTEDNFSKYVGFEEKVELKRVEDLSSFWTFPRIVDYLINIEYPLNTLNFCKGFFAYLISERFVNRHFDWTGSYYGKLLCSGFNVGLYLVDELSGERKLLELVEIYQNEIKNYKAFVDNSIISWNNYNGIKWASVDRDKEIKIDCLHINNRMGYNNRPFSVVQDKLAIEGVFEKGILNFPGNCSRLMFTVYLNDKTLVLTLDRSTCNGHISIDDEMNSLERIQMSFDGKMNYPESKLIDYLLQLESSVSLMDVYDGIVDVLGDKLDVYTGINLGLGYREGFDYQDGETYLDIIEVYNNECVKLKVTNANKVILWKKNDVCKCLYNDEENGRLIEMYIYPDGGIKYCVISEDGRVRGINDYEISNIYRSCEQVSCLSGSLVRRKYIG